MYVNKFLGRSLQFANGFGIGFNWVHGNGRSSRTSALIAGYQPPRSLTWLWALYWERPTKLLCLPKLSTWAPGNGHGGWSLILPIVGGLTFRRQPEMLK